MKPVTVKTAGKASLTEALAGATTPVSQVSVTVTEAALLGTKSLKTMNESPFRVFVMVHRPVATSAALQVAVEV